MVYYFDLQIIICYTCISYPIKSALPYWKQNKKKSQANLTWQKRLYPTKNSPINVSDTTYWDILQPPPPHPKKTRKQTITLPTDFIKRKINNGIRTDLTVLNLKVKPYYYSQDPRDISTSYIQQSRLPHHKVSIIPPEGPLTDDGHLRIPRPIAS